MKICFIDTLGLPYNGETVYKRGLGGSESATAYISKELHKLGFDVTVFNNCEDGDIMPGVFDGVKYSHIRTIPQSGCDWDVVIALRSVRPFCQTQFNDNLIFPDFTNIMQNAKYKVLMMHDTFCEGDNLIEYLVNTNHIDEIFTLSDWHTSYVTTCNHGAKRNFEILKKRIFQTRNGVGVIPEWVDIKQKDPFHFVYNASVTKGMIPLVTKIWPKIVEFEPRAKLTVIGGFYRFGENASPDQQELDWRKLVQDNPHNINFTGVISQKEISDILRYATYFLYPSAFPETFGISTLEALCHNVTPITCKNGALEETALDISSYKINYTIEKNWSCPWLNEEEQVEHFVNLVKWAMSTPYLQQQKAYSCNQVKGICGWDTVALQWKQHIYNKLGQYLPVKEYRKVNKINKKVSKVFGKTWVNQVEKTEPKQKETTQFVIVTPVYNAEKYIERCIMSVASQDYDNWEMWIIDDCSTDNTVKVIEGVLNNLSLSIEDKIYLIKNSKRQGAVRNQVMTIVNDIHCHEDQVVMLLDGDDWLVNDPTIFDKYNALYNDGAEFTYGSCWSVIDNIPLISQEYPEEIKITKNYRQYKFNWGMPYTHFRTFKAQMLHSFVLSAGTFPFKNSDGEWYKAGGDNSVFYYMIEAANPDKVICVPDVVYCYNDANPLCDYKVNSEEQNKTASDITKEETPEKFSVIIPTMWRAKEFIKIALGNYCNHPLVDEIILIDNDTNKTPDWDILNNPKIRSFKQERNIFVNPAWNFGVAVAKNNKLCIVNDDIVFDPKLFDKVYELVVPQNGTIGMVTGEEKFNHPPTTDGSISFKVWNMGDNTHGFGQLMFLHKNNWKPILDGLNIYYGDEFIFYQDILNNRKIRQIYNFFYDTIFAATTSDKSLVGDALLEENVIFNQYLQSLRGPSGGK